LTGSAVPSNSHRIARGLFLRLLAAIYVAAFLSLFFQITGLIGAQGVLPVGEFLARVREPMGGRGYYLLPTVFWFHSSDVFLKTVCAGGAGVAAVLLATGLWPRGLLFILWALYLSVVAAGQEFMGFQWDALLLETGFLAVFFAPAGFRPDGRSPAVRRGAPDTSGARGADPAFVANAVSRAPENTAFLWLLRALLFKLMFLSGVVKLMSGDAAWRGLSALQYHYETQPLPTALAWYAHQAWPWLQKTSVAAMFFIELILPFFIFAPRRWRQAAGAGLILLQLIIMLTGNYCFFNLNTIALCLLLYDDAFFRRWSPGRDPPTAPKAKPGKPLLAAAGILLFISVVKTADMLTRGGLPGYLRAAVSWTEPFRSVNTYGLFAVMTTTRPEIEVEGSNDGKIWKAYEFRWKPGSPARDLRYVAPHQPRLDWQMWFAALGDYRQSPWFMNFLARLLMGSKPVLDLLAENPFPERPPKYIRALLYDYKFTRRGEKKVWRRELKGLYCPVVSLRE